ncbi:MAG: hypothetical protein ACFCVC_17980 [Acidimicrobiia bacterium]
MNGAERYAAEVAAYLERLPRRERVDITADLSAELSEYPEAESFEALTHRLGPPDRYAAALAPDLRVKPGRRARPRGWKAWTVVGSLIGVLAWLLLATSPDPITGGGFFAPGDFDVRWADLSDEAIFRFESGHEGTFTVSVANTGALPVTVTEILLVNTYDPRASQTLVLMKPDPAWGMPEGDWAELDDTGYRLAPNEGALIRLGIAFADDCEHVDGGLSGIGPVMVRFSMLGTPRTAELDTPAAIWLEDLGGCS